MKKILQLLLMFGIISTTHAQQYLGVRNSNYAGILGATLNPSSMADSKLGWDINLGSASFTADNTFLYIPKDSLKFLGFGTIADLAKNKHYYTRFDHNSPNDLFDFTLSTELMGPSFMFSFAKHKHAIGFTSAARYYLVLNDVQGHQAQQAYAENRDTLLYKLTLPDDGIRLNTMAWFEYGLSYAGVFYQKNRNEIKGGITLKYLDGAGAAYVKNISGSYNIVNNTDLYYFNATADYGRTNYNTFENIHHYSDLIHGNGFGGNIGFTYVRQRDSADYTYTVDCKKWADPNKSSYLFRIGLSLTDVGSINFDKGAETFHIQTGDSVFWQNYRAYRFNSNLDFDHTLSAVLMGGDSSASTAATGFKMTLPTAISLQADWNVYKHFFLNATIIKSLVSGKDQGISRPDVYSLTPRYEQKWFEVSVPLSVLAYHATQTRVGLCVRAGWFFLGGDALGGVFAINDFEGADVYGGVHIFFPPRKLKDVPIKFDSVTALTVNCGELIPHTITYSNGLKGKRAKSGSVASTYSADPGPCGGDVIESWDVPGCHELHKQRTVHVNAPATPTFESASNITVECGQAKTSVLRYNNGAEGVCNVSGKVTSKLSVANADSACGVDIKERWDTTDACGNTLHAERTIHVNAAPVAPVKPQVVTTSQDDINRIQLSSQSILFKTGSPVLEPSVNQVLDQIALIMIKYPNAKWKVEGYCDITGSTQINLDLSDRRAEAVRDYLVKRGVKPENLSAKGYGKTNFIATNSTAAGRAKNRRVEIKQDK